MKKYTALSLAFILSLSVLGACDYEDSNPTDTTETKTYTESVTEDATADTALTENTADTTDVTASEDALLQTDGSMTQGNTLIETEEFAVVVTDCVTDSENAFTMNTYLKNKTDTTLEFKVTASAINGKDMHPDFSCDVKAGDGVSVPMNWSASKLSERRVTEVKEVKIELQVISYGDEVKLLSSDIYTINP